MPNSNQPKGGTDANRPDASGGQPERDAVKPEDEVRKAIQPEGGAGGRSGTGQAQPHHGFDDASGQQAMGEPVDKEAILPEPATGPDYQSGGSGLDLEQEVQERKQRESGVGSTKAHGPGRDPPPGAPVKPNR
jgi:hypothetical protein